MDTNEREYLNALAERVIGAAYEVMNTLGPGFLEKVYENALVVELCRRGVKGKPQEPIPVYYKDEEVGKYFVDVLVENELLVELKCCDGFCDKHLAVCLNYLKATGKKLLILINFQHAKVEWKRVVRGF
jgi:GxxExxY protein